MCKNGFYKYYVTSVGVRHMIFISCLRHAIALAASAASYDESYRNNVTCVTKSYRDYDDTEQRDVTS